MERHKQQFFGYCHKVIISAAQHAGIKVGNEHFELIFAVAENHKPPFTVELSLPSCIIEAGFEFSSGIFSAEMMIQDKNFVNVKLLFAFDRHAKIQPLRLIDLASPSS